MIPLPDKKYNVIYADPPWRFSSRELQTYNNKRFTPVEKHYKTQTSEWLKNLPVEAVADSNCALFMWTTDAHMVEAIDIMQAWGFKYVTIAFIWEKQSKTGKTLCNLGAWTLKNFEVCLLGTRGRMLQYKKVNNIRQKVAAERTKHSRKPARVRKNIEQLFGDVPRLELFARTQESGWDSWGDEL
jgi:site-specific DNA-methyltransferase (adenine-specific)